MKTNEVKGDVRQSHTKRKEGGLDKLSEKAWKEDSRGIRVKSSGQGCDDVGKDVLLSKGSCDEMS